MTIVRFAKNVTYDVTDRAQMKEALKEDDKVDFGVELGVWDDNSVPEQLVILGSRKDEDEEYPYYEVQYTHVNGAETSTYLYHDTLQSLMDAGILEQV